MRVQSSIPIKDTELLDVATTTIEAVKDSKLFANSAAESLVVALGEARNRFKVGIDDARFHDLLKIAVRKEARKELIGALKRVFHYIEAMASDDDLKELQKAGVRLTKQKTRKKKSSSSAEVDLAPAGA